MTTETLRLTMVLSTGKTVHYIGRVWSFDCLPFSRSYQNLIWWKRSGSTLLLYPNLEGLKNEKALKTKKQL